MFDLAGGVVQEERRLDNNTTLVFLTRETLHFDHH